MSEIYHNWERLVDAVLRKEQLWKLFHEQSRSPSILSQASDSSSQIHDVPFDFLSLGGSSSSSRAEDEIAKSGELVLPKLVFTAKFTPGFRLEDLLRACGRCLGEGTFGSAYSAILDNGITIVVKRLKPVSVSETQFRQHMEIVGSIRDENVATLRGFYWSRYEKLMLYDYHSNGNVSAVLHGKSGENKARVDWATRLKIAIGAARGLAHIHSQSAGKLVHGNIKASNIFLNTQHYGFISDIGLAHVIATKFVSNAHCYAPEVKDTRNVSQASDVYSFGVLLLELLTRRSPAPAGGGYEGVDLVKWISSFKRKKWTAEVFDIDLPKDHTVKEQIVKMLQIGLSCVVKSPKRRPKISAVVQMIEDVFMMNAQVSRNTERNRLVFFEGGNHMFDLEDLLRASAEVLGKGTFGTSYKAVLENGTMIMVKRSREVIVPKKEFQQHIEVIGRIQGHENIAELRAYYHSKDELLLVYDYYKHSLSAMLHGKRGSGRRHLDWTRRLKIAIGAARGIAYIHRQDDGKLVHGSIRDSNIFLNEHQYGRVCDVGLAKLLNPMTLSDIREAGHCAPEVTDITKLSQSSDVYSFGVVLLELVSGYPATWIRGHKTISLTWWVECVLREEWTDEVFDEELLRYPHDGEAMMQLLQLAISCVVVVPERRPKMVDVLRKLEQIVEIETESSTIQ